MSRDSGYDRFLTIFSPEGSLYQIEYAKAAVVNASGYGGATSAVGVRGKDSVVLVCQKKVSDKLIDPSSVTRLFSLTPTLGAVVVGMIADGRSVISQARQEVAQFEYKNGYPMPASMIAKRMADLAQVNTQHAGRRTMATDIMLVSIDEGKPQLYKIDPAGFYFGYKATACGADHQEAVNILEKKLEKNPDLSFDDAVQTAIMTLQQTVSSDFKNDEIEVGVIERPGANFRKLTEKEIDTALDAIKERD